MSHCGNHLSLESEEALHDKEQLILVSCTTQHTLYKDNLQNK